VHGWQLKEATTYQIPQRHRIRQRLATGAWRDFHENKIARLPYLDPSTEYARTLRHLEASDARWRAGKNRAQSYMVGLGNNLWQDRATIQFRFLRPASRFTGSFCVFGPVLSSPAHGPPSLAMAQV
jgi:hypothetical protein